MFWRHFIYLPHMFWSTIMYWLSIFCSTSIFRCQPRACQCQHWSACVWSSCESCAVTSTTSTWASSSAALRLLLPHHVHLSPHRSAHLPVKICTHVYSRIQALRWLVDYWSQVYYTTTSILRLDKEYHHGWKKIISEECKCFYMAI